MTDDERLIKASQVTPENVKWLWRERIPRGTLSFIAGKPEQGKGLFTCHLAADVTKEGGTVLFSSWEESYAVETRPRLEAAGAVLSRVLLRRFQLPTHLELVEEIVRSKKIDLIVMDPVAAHLAGGANRFTDKIRTVLNPLSRLIQETDTAAVFVEHALKKPKQSGHILEAVPGSSSGLPAACRVGYVFGIDPGDEDSRYLCHAKNNLRERPPAVRFELDVREVFKLDSIPALVLADDEAVFDGMRLFDNSKEARGRGNPGDKRAAAAEWLTHYLQKAGKPVKSGVVIEDAKQFGMTLKTLRRAATDMGVIRKPPGGGRNCTWELPPQILELLDSGGEPDENDSKAPKPPKKIDNTKSKEKKRQEIEDEGEELTDEDISQLLGGGESE